MPCQLRSPLERFFSVLGASLSRAPSPNRLHTTRTHECPCPLTQEGDGGTNGLDTCSGGSSLVKSDIVFECNETILKQHEVLKREVQICLSMLSTVKIWIQVSSLSRSLSLTFLSLSLSLPTSLPPSSLPPSLSVSLPSASLPSSLVPSSLTLTHTL
jgi:hypothetical protein